VDIGFHAIEALLPDDALLADPAFDARERDRISGISV
jgi:hypothetical protein